MMGSVPHPWRGGPHVRALRQALSDGRSGQGESEPVTRLRSGSMQDARGRGRPTIRDVAVAAGVSRATVSRVLNGGSRVSPEALSSVNAAIARTGYSANRHARALSAGRSHTVAFLLT